MRSAACRRGFALVTVLWVVTIMGVLALALTLTARGAVAGAQARLDWHRASWRAEGCAAMLQARLDAALREDQASAQHWGDLDAIAAATALPTGCSVRLEAAGTRLNVNTASTSSISRALVAHGFTPVRADSMAAAVLDWRDADAVPTPGGAEETWYRDAARPLPRNGPLASVGELRQVRGFEQTNEADLLLGVGADRVALSHAPAWLIRELPGMSDEAVAALLSLRASQPHDGALNVVAGRLSAPARAELLAALPELAARAADQPDAWEARISVAEGTPPLRVELFVRYRNAGTRVAVVTQRFVP